MASCDGEMLMMDLDTPGTSTQTLLTYGSTFTRLTQAQEQLMYTLEKGYNASTEVLKHLSVRTIFYFMGIHKTVLSDCNSEKEMYHVYSQSKNNQVYCVCMMPTCLYGT